LAIIPDPSDILDVNTPFIELTWLLAFILYLYSLRRLDDTVCHVEKTKKKEFKFCPKCEAAIPADLAVCPYCGYVQPWVDLSHYKGE